VNFKVSAVVSVNHIGCVSETFTVYGRARDMLWETCWCVRCEGSADVTEALVLHSAYNANDGDYGFSGNVY